MNDYPEPTWAGNKRNFVVQYADDFTQVIVTKCNRVNDNARAMHRENVQSEISKQNIYEKMWKVKSNLSKFKIIMIANKPKQNIQIEDQTIVYSKKAKIVGLNFKSRNFFIEQVNENIRNANSELKRLYRLRYLNKKLKCRLYKSKVLPYLTYASVPLNICSKSQMKRLQVIQNKGIRWITNRYYPNICNIDEQQALLKIEPISQRINKLAQNIWYKIETENSPFFLVTKNIPVVYGHAWFKSSYAATFD